MAMFGVSRDHSRSLAAAPRTRLALPLLVLFAGCGDDSAATPPQDHAPLLIDGGTVVVMDEAGTILEGGAVLVEGDRISALIAAGEPRPDASRSSTPPAISSSPAWSTRTATPPCRCCAVSPTTSRS